ncbi:MAG TPA: GTP-binding protein, partial [Sedimentisphaerales bacterium]|nr:GTP-binding protein [Sedimentisphaerales bacterium]
AFYSFTRVQRSLRMSDVAVFMMDAAVPLSQVDKKLAQVITDDFKACVLVVNKWDLAREHAQPEAYAEYIGKMLPGLQFAPIVLASATEKLNVDQVLELVRQVHKQATMKIPTPKLNKAIEMIMSQRGPGSKRGAGVPKIYYATQVAVEPVTIMLFVNKPRLFDENYQRYMVGRLREILAVKEVPLRLIVKGRSASDNRDAGVRKPGTVRKKAGTRNQKLNINKGSRK